MNREEELKNLRQKLFDLQMQQNLTKDFEEREMLKKARKEVEKEMRKIKFRILEEEKKEGRKQ